MRLGSGKENPAAWPSLWPTDKRGFLCRGSHTLGLPGVTAHEKNICRGKRPRCLNRGSAPLAPDFQDTLSISSFVLCIWSSGQATKSLSVSGECLEQTMHQQKSLQAYRPRGQA